MSDSRSDILLTSNLPIFFEIQDIHGMGLNLPVNRHGQSTRLWARSLTVMQKEAIIVSARSKKAWRLASDEGPYLNGFDTAPCPLSFFTVGMVSAYMNEILALAKDRDVAIKNIELVQDNYYTMEGSALQGTMMGGALPVDLEVRIDCDAEDGQLNGLLLDAVHASPLNSLMTTKHPSLFSLTKNGQEIELGAVAAIGGNALPNPGDRFQNLQGTEPDVELIKRLDAVEAQRGVAGGIGTSLQSEQSRTLHVRGTCRLRPDGVKEITQELFRPLGSTFQFLSEETEEFGGHGRAPDAVSYISAGIAFCFMTQLGRYAKIVEKNLDEYKVVQDSHFPLGGASSGTGQVGTADPLETHTYLDTSEDDAFAQKALDMGEQTCFLHAFCRTELKTNVKIVRA